jgi:hypothetical protein
MTTVVCCGRTAQRRSRELNLVIDYQYIQIKVASFCIGTNLVLPYCKSNYDHNLKKKHENPFRFSLWDDTI